MKNLYRLMAFVCVALAIRVDVANTNLASTPLLYATCALLLVALVFLLIGFDMRREESQRSELFTRRAHEPNADASTFEVDGQRDSSNPHRS